MTKTELEQEYFDWLYFMVEEDKPRKKPTYIKLLSRLHETEFTYILGLDMNQAAHGEDLRYTFGSECGYPEPMIAAYLDDRSCSVLEMMVALAINCEEHIMFNPEYGNRTGKWFWDMIESLGLGDMYDSRYSRNVVDAKVHRFLNRTYARNGAGGLFTVNNKNRYDLRTIDIWYQAMWYLDEQLAEG